MQRLTEIQKQHKFWRERNFPDQTLEQALLGMAEEFGEMCHAILKNSQGIREYDDDRTLEEVIDAHADWIIFSFFVANHFGYDLDEAVAKVWLKVVSKRNWVDNPATGGEQ